MISEFRLVERIRVDSLPLQERIKHEFHYIKLAFSLLPWPFFSWLFTWYSQSPMSPALISLFENVYLRQKKNWERTKRGIKKAKSHKHHRCFLIKPHNSRRTETCKNPVKKHCKPNSRMLNPTLSQPSSTSGFSILNPNHLHTKFSSYLHYSSFPLNPKKPKTPFPHKLSINKSPHFEHFQLQNNKFTAINSSLSPPGMQFLAYPFYVCVSVCVLAKYCVLYKFLKNWILS